MTDFNTHPQPRTFAPSKEERACALALGYVAKSWDASYKQQGESKA